MGTPSDPLSPAGVVWRCRRREIVPDRPVLFGVLNVTPDSFSDGGRYVSLDAALNRVERMVAEGADGIDVGGESTRPQGAQLVSVDEELCRVVPAVREIRARFSDVIVSVDTTKSAVAEVALQEGADVINDVSGLRLDPRLGDIVAAFGAGVVLMHSRGGVAEMGTYRFAEYGSSVVAEVVQELRTSVQSASAAGISRDHIVVDPGIGFAKKSEHSLRLLAELDQIVALGFPVMVGVSRKRFVGELSGVKEPSDRVFGTAGANVVALTRGARIFRVHDVAQNRQALDVAWGIIRTGDRPPALSSQFPVPRSDH